MEQRTKADLLMVAIELRLAARDGDTAIKRLTKSRLSEMADFLEGAANRVEPDNQNAFVQAITDRRASPKSRA